MSAKINKLFDTMLPSIHHFIVKHGLDPLKLKDLSENLVVEMTTTSIEPVRISNTDRSFLFSSATARDNNS